MDMKLILLSGPQAVGKMTVGQELEKITNLKLFHNHMTIDLVAPFFSYNSEVGKKLVHSFRMQIFEEVANSDLEGLIFTYVMNYDEEEEWEYLDRIQNIFKKQNAQIYYVELEADLEERLKRNRTENRMKNKPTKRDIEVSEQRVLGAETKHRQNSYPKEVENKGYSNYFKINNTKLSAEEVAKQIKEKWNL